MRRTTVCTIALLLSACSPPTTSSAPEASSPAVEVAQTASAAPAAGIERVCAGFDIVNEEISPMHGGVVDNLPGMAMIGRTMAAAGADIEDLAIGVEAIPMSSALRTLGQRFQEDGARVQQGDLAPLEDTTDSTTVYYLELLDQYGSEC